MACLSTSNRTLEIQATLFCRANDAQQYPARVLNQQNWKSIKFCKSTFESEGLKVETEQISVTKHGLGKLSIPKDIEDQEQQTTL